MSKVSRRGLFGLLAGAAALPAIPASAAVSPHTSHAEDARHEFNYRNAKSVEALKLGDGFHIDGDGNIWRVTHFGQGWSYL